MTDTKDTATPLDGVTTFTGETLVGALAALDVALPKGAYKAVSLGGRTFTDISPAYSLEVISEHFGPLGLGWGFVIEDEHTSDHKTADKTQSDGTIRHGQHYLGVTLRIRLWFETRGTREGVVEWQSYGGNANAGSGADEHFSWQGALTNAIGKGWSMQGFQRRIYKGEDFTLDEKREANGDSAPAAAPKAAPAPKTYGASGTQTHTAPAEGEDYKLKFSWGGREAGTTLSDAVRDGDIQWLKNFATSFGFNSKNEEDPKWAAENAKRRAIAGRMVVQMESGSAPAPAPVPASAEDSEIPF